MVSGVLNIRGYVTGLPSGSETINLPQVNLQTCHGERMPYTVDGNTTIPVPPAPSGGTTPVMAIISFPASMTAEVYAKGDTGDTGFRIDVTPSGATQPLPALLPLGGSPSSIILSSSVPTTLEILWL